MALHLYGVTAADAAPPDGAEGRGGAPLRVVSDGLLAVIVSEVPCATGPVGEYVIAAVGTVLSTVNVAPLVGADVTTFPARSVLALRATVAVPLPEPTVCVYV